MRCVSCSHVETKVVDSRETEDGRVIRRRRECEKCGVRFSTYEAPEIMRLTVVKKDGSKQDYSRQKLESGIRRALEKRPVGEAEIEKVISDIEYEIQSKEAQDITSKEIGKIVLERLKALDEVAYLRFASVYKSFGSAEAFRREADKITKEAN